MGNRESARELRRDSKKEKHLFCEVLSLQEKVREHSNVLSSLLEIVGSLEDELKRAMEAKG